MGAFEPQDALILLAGTGAFIFLICLIVAAIVQRSRTGQQSAVAHNPTPEFGSLKRPQAPATDTERTMPPVAPPTRVAVPQAAAPAPQQSYAAIAAAQASRNPAKAASAPIGTAIDYTNALTDVRPDASYTSAAIASLLGIAPNANTPPREARTSTSYAAIAVASASHKPRAEAAPDPRIDYSGETVELPPNASYAAIAVAAAARQH